MKVYVFGNPLLKEDSLQLNILPDLKKTFPKIHFEIVDPNENFPPEKEKNLIILDTVKGIKEPKIFGLNDLQDLKKSPNSPHDYDPGMHLLLLRKMRKIDKVIIIGIPFAKSSEEIIDKLSNVIDIVLSQQPTPDRPGRE